jgi:hypothetical protein
MLSSTNLLKSGAFDGLNSFQMLFVSIFSKMSHDNYSTLTEVYKLPFTIHSEELQYYDIPNPYLGGWGSLFGGLFIVSILVILVHTFCKWKERDFQYKASIFYVFFTILLLCILPGTYMARFAGHLYVVVIMATVILLSSLYKKTKLNLIFSKSMAVIMCILIFGNIAPWINTQRKIISESVDINAHISYLHKYEDKNIKLAILNPDYHALAFDMRDQNIHFELVPYDKIDSSYKRFYNWQLYYKVEE